MLATIETQKQEIAELTAKHEQAIKEASFRPESGE